MKIKFISILSTIICLLLTNIVSAENKAIDKYRNIFNSGEYFIEYEEKNIPYYLDDKMKKYIPKEIRSLAVRNDEIKGMSNYYVTDFSGKHKEIPDITVGVFKNGKYYYCVNNKKGYVFNLEKLDDINFISVNYGSDAQYVHQSTNKYMKLPENIRYLFIEDRNYDLSGFKPVYKKSYEEFVDGNRCDVDEYVANYSATSFSYDTIDWEETYKVYYQNGILCQITVFSTNNKNLSVYKINKINNVVTNDMLVIPSKYKFYSAPKFDMNGLLNQEVLVEET